MKYLILLLLLSFNLNAGDWSKEDQQRQMLYTVFHIIDWGQTLNIAASADDFYETNKLMGKHPSEDKVNAYMALTLAGNWVIAKNINKKYRKTFQLTSIGALALVILRNAYLGLSIKF